MLALVLPLAAGWVKTSDFNALVELYEATGGASWEPSEEAPEEFTDPTKGNEWWAVDDIYSNDPCPQNITHHWHGVACVDPCYYPIDGDDCRFGRITGLWLPFNGLEGTIPQGFRFFVVDDDVCAMQETLAKNLVGFQEKRQAALAGLAK